MRAGTSADGGGEPGRRAGPGTAAAAVRDYLLEQVSALHWALEDGDVHDARVACRRTRSVLLAHVDLFARPRRQEVVAVAARARDLGRELSAARDAEVVEEVVRAWGAEDGWPRDRVEASVRLLGPAGASDGAVDLAREHLLALSDAVGSLAASPLWGPGGDEPAVPGLAGTRAQELARLARRVRTALAVGADPARDEPWHDVRKAAKRLRYTAEVAQQAGDAEAGAQAVAARRLQTALGDLQDLQLVRERLDEVATGLTRTEDLALHADLEQHVDRTSVTARSDVQRALAETVGAVVGGSSGPTPPAPEDLLVTLPADPDPAFADYAHPERLVSTQWLQDHLGQDGLVVVESDEDVLLYETGHIPGAVKVDWHLDLNDPVTRDYVDGEAFARLMGSKGITRDTTVVVYGDKNNWWAAYALWVFSLFGHEDVRLLDGGRAKWEAEMRPYTTEAPQVTPVDYPVVERDDASIRAFLDDVRAHLGKPMVDVRSPEEYSGERTHMPAYPEEGALRGGHIPGAQSVPWARAAAQDGTFKRRSELEAIYQGEKGLSASDDVVAYCRIGERSSHTWFVLTHLLGFEKVRNYDGSWTEWGNVVRVPIVKGTEPGDVPGGVPSR